MQSRVIVSGEPLLVNDVPEQVKDPGGVYYDVDREGHMRKIPDEGPPGVQSAMMLPVKHEGQVVGVVQLMHERAEYDQEQLELAEGLIGLMAAAGRNARLHERAQEEAAARARAEAIAAEREHAARVLAAVGDGIFLVDQAGSSGSGIAQRSSSAAAARDERVVGRAAEVFDGWDADCRRDPDLRGSAPAREPGDAARGRRGSGAVAVVRGRSELCRRGLRLPRPHRRARLEEAKSDFIATVSHELRTPMTAVLGAAKTLLREDIVLSPEERQKLLVMIDSQATRLAQITEEVLLASRLDRGDLSVDRERLDLADVVRGAVETMRGQLPESISLAAKIDDGAAAVGDRDRIEQVLLNLIDNAVKYSPHGGAITVSADRLATGVRVEVEDEGIGIAQSEQGAIFEKFYRADPHQRHVPSGTGLGLYISRELVRRMGGSIGVRSQPGQGSTFFFELPSA